jgi:hypothetical protein
MTVTEAEVNAALRHVASFGAGAATVLICFGAISADSAHQAVAAINQVVDGLSQATGGVFKLVVILGPAVAAIAARFAAKSASPIAQINAVAANPDVQKVVTTPAIATAIPSNKVVSQ